MKRTLFALLCAASLLPCASAHAQEADDDGEYEEIVIRRRVRRPVAPAATNAAPAEAKADEPPPPPEPSAEDAAEPRRLVRYFCKCWKDADYERMWWAMTPKYRAQTPLRKFTALFEADKEMNGGLRDENIVLDDAELDDGGIRVVVDLTYRFKRVPVRRVKAEVEKTGPAYRVRASGILPVDLDDL